MSVTFGILVIAQLSYISAQCGSGTSGLAILDLEAPSLTEIEPLICGEEYSFVFSYNYLFTPLLSDGLDESSLNISFNPPNSGTIISGPNIAGAFIIFTFTPNSGTNITVQITVDDISSATNLSCADLTLNLNLDVFSCFENCDASHGALSIKAIKSN